MIRDHLEELRDALGLFRLKKYAEAMGPMGSEACLQLDFGAGTLPGLLILAAKDAEQFSPAQGTDLLTFFATIFERALRRWLA